MDESGVDTAIEAPVARWPGRPAESVPVPRGKPAKAWPGRKADAPEKSINPFKNIWEAYETAGKDIAAGAGIADVSSIREQAAKAKEAPWYDIRPEIAGTLQRGKSAFELGKGLFEAQTAPFTAAAQTAGNLLEKGETAAGITLGGKPAISSEEFQFSLMGAMPPRSRLLEMPGVMTLVDPAAPDPAEKPAPSPAAAGASPAPRLREPAILPSAERKYTGRAKAQREALLEQALIRQRYGLAERDIATAFAQLEPYRRSMNEATPEMRWDLIDAAQGDKEAFARLTPEFKRLSEVFRKQDWLRREKFARVWSLSDMKTQQDYFAQLYKEDEALQAFLGRYVGEKPGAGGVQGAAGLTKKKKAFPTWKEAREAGLSPRYSNPIDLALAHEMQASHLIAAYEIKDAMHDAGVLKYGKGPPAEGWAPIDGRFARNAGGMQGYAPAELAAVYNKHVGKGFEPSTAIGKTVWESVNRVSNLSKQMKFAVSAYHATTTTMQSLFRTIASSVEQLAQGNIGKAVKTLEDLAIVPAYQRGSKGLKVWAGESDPQWDRVIYWLTQANPNFKGTGQDFFYHGESIGQMLKRRSIKQNFNEYINSVKAEAAGSLFKGAGRALSGALEGFEKGLRLTTAPVFEHYVPQIKMGNMMRDMAAWLEANPGAAPRETVLAAMKIADHAEDIFGESSRFNLQMMPGFSKKVLQTLDLAMLSTSYVFGSLRALGRGAYHIGKGAVMTAAGKGKEAPSFSPASPHYDPAMSYIIGILAGLPMVNATIQWLMTNELPDDPWDFAAPKTGGKTLFASGKGGMYEKPERIRPIGDPKEIITDMWRDFGFAGGAPRPAEYLKPKANAWISALTEILFNTDWRGVDIWDWSKGGLGRLAGHIGEAFSPISLEQGLITPAQKGTAIPGWMRFLGFAPAGMHITAPEEYRQMMNERARQQLKRREMYERRAKVKAGKEE
ncbi:MAG TPA: hypothetical protein VFF88_11250 [Methylocella sp.]|nr:hypothetical protein [Methylocella sp.]